MSNSFANLWPKAHQIPLSVGLPRQEYCNGVSFPSSADLPDPGFNPRLLHWQVGSLPLSHQGSPQIKKEPHQKVSSWNCRNSEKEPKTFKREKTMVTHKGLGGSKWGYSIAIRKALLTSIE